MCLFACRNTSEVVWYKGRMFKMVLVYVASFLLIANWEWLNCFSVSATLFVFSLPPFLCVWQYQMSCDAIDVTNCKWNSFTLALVESLISNNENIGLKIQDLDF